MTTESGGSAYANQIVLRQWFKEYYFNSAGRLSSGVDEIPQREWGFTLFGKEGLVRHKSYSSEEEVQRYLTSQTPQNVYHSSGYYLFPSREMAHKEWMGADVVFDIDADHLHHRDLDPHLIHVCQNCNLAYEEDIEKCEVCEGPVSPLEWLTEEDLGLAKEETSRLVETLTEDFGIDGEEQEIYFSGNRGYHVHVLAEEFRDLSQEERGEMADYLFLTDFRLESSRFAGMEAKRQVARIVADEDFLQRQEPRVRDELVGFADAVQREEQTVTESLSMLGPRARELLEGYVRGRMKVGIDPVVTSDTHRLIRAPYSLHGTTGLGKTRVEDLADFEPRDDAVYLPDADASVRTGFVPQFHMKEEVYGPWDAGVVDVPSYVAAFLIGTGVAQVE